MKLDALTYKIGSEDPKQVVLDKIGDAADKVQIFGSRVLVATAPRGIRNILLPDKSVEEERWQGKIGLLIKAGEDAFAHDPRYPSYEWSGPKPTVGDWVVYRTSDTWEVGLAGISCRFVFDDNIVGTIDSLEVIY